MRSSCAADIQPGFSTDRVAFLVIGQCTHLSRSCRTCGRLDDPVRVYIPEATASGRTPARWGGCCPSGANDWELSVEHTICDPGPYYSAEPGQQLVVVVRLAGEMNRVGSGKPSIARTRAGRNKSKRLATNRNRMSEEETLLHEEKSPFPVWGRKVNPKEVAKTWEAASTVESPRRVR